MGAYTRKLACFCSKLDYGMIPDKIVKKIKWVILDDIGVVVGATALDVGKRIAGYTRALGDRAEATVLGFGFKSSTRNAAFANGTLSEALEMQDGYSKGNIHPGCSTVPACLAVAEWRKKTGKDLITAVTAGNDSSNRVAESISPSHLSKGFQPTGTVGTIGAAAAAAKLLGLNEDEMFNALTIAGFILPISTGDNLWGGYSIKPVHAGAAAKGGIEAALLAQQGFNAAPLEGDHRIGKGFCRIVSDGAPRFEKMVEGLGKNYNTIAESWFKPYATCRMNHAPVNIALELSKKHDVKAEDVKEILIRTVGESTRRTGAMKTNSRSSFIECQFSMAYAVAGALMDGEVGLRQLTEKRIRDPKIHRLASKVRVMTDAELDKMYPAYRPAIMEIETKDGKKVSGRVDYPKGDYLNPMTEEELISKFFNLTVGLLGKNKAKKAVDAILDLENLDSVGNLIRYLR